ncbi:MAG: phage tail tape measure protein [Chloroflexi bacterium]|nr:phage tail tape measure protein [Chloroflexota bacterium]
MSTTIESLVGQLGYDYDKSGLNAAIGDQREFLKATTDVGAGMASTTQQGGAMGGVLGGIGKHKAGMLAVAGGAAALGLGIISATGSARNYESALASIDTLGPQVAAHHAEFKDQILDVSTAMGQDLVGSTNAVYDALSSGVPPDNVIDFMSTASKAAVAGATDTGTSVRALTATLNAWKLNAAEAGNVSDVFFTGVNVGVFRFEDLANSIGQVAPLAASLGVTYQEVTAATATLTKSGLTASQAITQQRASMVSLITPNREMSGVLKQLALDNEDVARTAEEQGISIGEAALRTLGYQGAMVAVRDSAKNADVELAKAAGSVESLGAFLGLSGENAVGAAADLDLMSSSAGASQAAFDTMAETTDAKMAKFRAAWEAAKVSVGDLFLPVLASLAEAAVPVMNFLADGARMLQPLAAGFDSLPGPIKMVGAALAAMTAGGVGLAGGAIALAPWMKHLKEFAPLADAAKGRVGGLISTLMDLGGSVAGESGLQVVLGQLPKLGSLSTVAKGGIASLTGSLSPLQSVLGMASGGLTALGTAAKGAIVAAGPIGVVLGAVALAGYAAYKGVSSANAALDEQFAAAQKAGGGFQAYLGGAQRARDESGLLGKAGFLLKDVWHGLTDAWHRGLAALQPVGEWFSSISDKAAGLIQSVTGISGGLMGLGSSLLKMIPGVGAISMLGGALTDQNGAVRDATVAWLEMEKGIDPAILKTSEFATAQAQLGAKLDDGSLSQEEYSQRLLGVARELGGVEAAGGAAAREIASTGEALAMASAGAEQAVGGFQQYSDALIGMVGGAAIGFDPNAERDEDQLEKLDKENQQQREAQAQHFGSMMQSRREFNAQHTALLAEGKTAEVATLAEQYASEQSMQVEHLAQLAINHVNSMLQMNNISEQQAQLIYGSIASAFPGADIFDGSTAAMMEFSTVMGQALAGNEEAALRLGGVIASTPDRLTEGQEAVDSYASLSIQRYEEAKAAAEAHATGISDAGAIVSTGVTSAADATGAATALMVESYASSQSAAGNHAAVTEADAARVRGALTTTADVGDSSSGRMEQAYERSGVAATQHAESTSAAGADAAGSVETMAGGIGTSLQSAGTEFKKAGQTASGAGTQIRGAFGGLGQQIEGDARRGTTALGELGTKQQEVVQQSRNLGAASQAGFGAGAGAAQQAARGIASSADDIGGALVEAGEGSVRLGDELAELPDRVEIEIEVLGMAQIFTDLRRLNGTINDIRANARRPFPIGTGDSGDNRGGGGGGGAPPRGGGPQSVLPPSSTFSAPPTWMDDLRDMADVGVSVNASLNDESGGALLSATGGDLLYKRYLDALAAADYDVTVHADLDETDILGQIDAAMQAAAGLLDILEEQHRVFLRGNEAEQGSLAWLIQNWRSSGFGEVDFAEVMRQLNVPAATLDEFIQHFEGLDPEAQGELWKRFYDDLRRMEKDRHEQRMTALKDEQDGTKKGYDDQIEGIRDAREAAQKAGVENLDAFELQIEALEKQRDTAIEGIEARRRAEEERNDAVERALEEQDRLIKRQQEDYEDGLKRAAALEKEREELRKAYHKALQDEQKENEEIEKEAHDLTLEMLADLKQAQEEQHDARLELLDEEKRREDEMHKARLAQLDDELRRERAHLDGLEDQMAELKIEMAELKLDTGPLEAAKSLLDQIKEVIGDLDDARRNRAGQVQLDDGARAALEAALATGRLSEAGARRAQRVLGGAALGAAQMRALLEEAAGLLTGNVKQEETVLDAKQRELDMLQIQIDKEKLRFDRAADAIKDQQDAEKARHDARMDAIADQVDAEKRAWDAFVDRLDAAKRAEDERHDAKMRQIEAEFRARLIAEGLIEEAGRDPEAALERARQIAEEIFGRLSQLVNGGGAAVTPPPTLVPPGPPGGPAPILPPGGPGLPPGPSPYSDGTGDDGLTPFGRFATAMQSYQQGQLASAIPVIIAGVEQAASSNALLGGVNFTYNQYAPNQVFDATDAPAEWIDALYGVVGLRSAP